MGRRRRRSKKLDADPVQAHIESLSHEGRGITHIDDKVVFISGALADEDVMFRYTATRRNYDDGAVVEVLKASPDRVEPACEYFNICGGCSMQHMDTDKQIIMKQEVLLNQFQRTSQIEPQNVLPPLTSAHWGYRTKARLGVRYVAKKERALVGFREKQNSYLADMHSCEVLDPRVGHKLDNISDCIGKLEARDKVAQIEVAITEDVVGLVFRNLVELSDADKQLLIDLAKTEDFHVYLQPAGPDSVQLLYPRSSTLMYALPDFGVELQFLPLDFTQVNTGINQQMIKQAMELLEPGPDDNVLDLFCGLGNFSLPIATLAGKVTAVEGDAGLIDRARENAQRNNLDNVEFHVQDLSADLSNVEWAQQSFSKVLIDPARPGALEMMEVVAKMAPERIVYVSCNPATLARDAGELVNKFGYTLVSAGVMDMFPHTAHVESMALFKK